MFSRLRTVPSANQTVPTVGKDPREVGECPRAAPCLPLPISAPHPASAPHQHQQIFSLVPKLSHLCCCFRHPEGPPHPVEPSSPSPEQRAGFKGCTTGTVPSSSPSPSSSQPASAGTGGMQQTTFWEHKPSRSQLCPIHTRKSLSSSLPLPKSILSLPFPTYNGVNRRHIYSAWLGTKVKLEVLAVPQPKAEMSALQHHKHFKVERKSIWRVFY